MESDKVNGAEELREACRMMAEGITRFGDVLAAMLTHAPIPALARDTPAGRAKSVPKTAGRREKDPNAPKRPLSSFLLFSREKRAQLAAQRPELSFAQQTSVLAEEWKKVDKRPYEERANAEMAAYKEALQSYSSGTSTPAAAAGGRALSEAGPSIVVSTPAVAAVRPAPVPEVIEEPVLASPEKKKKKKKSRDADFAQA